MSKLLVISGPIAAGKSTVASALAATFRKSGRSVAVVDLDRLYMMLDDPAPMSDPSHSREARRAAAALTDHFVLDGIELVILEGTFWTLVRTRGTYRCTKDTGPTRVRDATRFSRGGAAPRPG